jgi:hypothetical protein
MRVVLDRVTSMFVAPPNHPIAPFSSEQRPALLSAPAKKRDMR